MTRSQGKPAVPENVADQIHLWERERTRLHLAEAYLYTDFPTLEEYTGTVRRATELGCLEYKSERTPLSQHLVVTAEGHRTLKAENRAAAALSAARSAGAAVHSS